MVLGYLQMWVEMETEVEVKVSYEAQELETEMKVHYGLVSILYSSFSLDGVLLFP